MTGCGTHALWFRSTGFGVIYDCACGDFTEVANDDDDCKRVYDAHAEHIQARPAHRTATHDDEGTGR